LILSLPDIWFERDDLHSPIAEVPGSVYKVRESGLNTDY
jgi:hypothetical protein